MKRLMKSIAILSLVIIGGLSIGLGINWGPQLLSLVSAEVPMSSESSSKAAGNDGEPLYWVAPMDPNYRRDGPGKSPMGMDLVPVYDEPSADLAPGTVEISPAVVNNLGARTAEVERDVLTDTIDAVGYVGFDERKLEEIHARVAGWLQRLHVRADGDPVERFEALYDIYSPELISAQEELLVALRSDDPVLIDASEDKLTSLGVSGGTIRRIRENRTVIPQVRVYAPQAGVVDSLSVGQGAYVTPGQRIMRIASMDPVWVEGEIFESQLPKLRRGAAVEVRAEAVPGRVWQGTVDYIYPVLDGETRTARIRVVLANEDGALLPNMFTQLTIRTVAPEPTLLVDRDAVIRTGTMERVVLALGEGRFKSVEVSTGLRSRERVQILEGLEAGDEIVVSAQFLIDSESSISSDFRRMSEPEPPTDSVWATGVVDAVYADEAIVEITHEPVPEWEWPGMTMEFLLDETIDPTSVSDGEPIRFRMTKSETGEYVVDALDSQDATGAAQ